MAVLFEVLIIALITPSTKNYSIYTSRQLMWKRK